MKYVVAKQDENDSAKLLFVKNFLPKGRGQYEVSYTANRFEAAVYTTYDILLMPEEIGYSISIS